MATYIVSTEKLDFTYLDGTKALDSLSIKIPEGKKVAFIGNNGAGKTTLLLHFNGINRPDGGEVRYNGQKMDYSSKGIKELRKKVGIVFQDTDSQLFSGSVYQDVSFGPMNLGWPEGKIRIKLEQVMKEAGIWELRDKPPHLLSYGQKKRVAIAGVLAMEPELIILDEPTAALDPVCTSQVMSLLNTLNTNGATIIVSSHNMDEVYAWADFVFVLKEGKVIAEGSPINVFRRQDVLAAASLKNPLVLELYDKLVSSGMLAKQEDVPATPEALIALLATGKL
ncbi:MAG: ATP-binding cassette domain-containing protein [Firmicutes bacterium]|jgi:cobalt/nickel transport system ATP-binding protein|nr:ATP-binding cassette domain-containing protein [Dethiobacter sp.]MBS4009114.1 ATP-binding cassette domain-containing protein [Clostridium sp.]MCL5992891.1 ATP-binding cassette domain-containing protein [Bacillota bacterium]